MNEIFASIYEAGGLFYIEFEDFSNQLYNYEIYTPIGWVLILSSLIWMFLYYKIDHVNFSRWYHWLIWLAILCAINFVFAYYWSVKELTLHFEEEGIQMPYSGEFVNFSLINVLYAIVLGILLSLMLKKIAVNTKTTPF
jgi:hypothetical protein